MDIVNDPELNGKYLGTISRDFVKVCDTIKEASYLIRKRGFSDFPIFPISHDEIPIGQLLIPKEALDISWNFYAAYLDEFVQRNVIDVNKQDAFKAIYKDPDEFCCLFVADNEFTKFTFIPYPID